MGHPTIINATPFAFSHLLTIDEHGRDILVMIVKATLDIGPSGQLTAAAKQVEIDFSGKYSGIPGESSPLVEPESAFYKPATDVVLRGHAYARRPGDVECAVGLMVGPLKKVVRVTGDRHWVRGLVGAPSMTRARPFERIALRHENAFGGADPACPPGAPGSFDARNPVGTGYVVRWREAHEPIRLPNLEMPGDLVRGIDDRPAPAGFGFIDGHWQPRSAWAGTYDAAWERDRRPLLPVDFDRRFFNGAPVDQRVEGFLRGDEEVRVANATRSGMLQFRLPGIDAPSMAVEWRMRGTETLVARFDTLAIDADEARLCMTWRACTPMLGAPTDIAAMRIAVENTAWRRPATLQEA